MIRNIALFLPPLLALNGCAYIDAIGAKFASLTNPVAMTGFIVGIDLPDDENINQIIDEAGIPLGTAITLLVVDAADAQSLDDAVVRDATVTIQIQGEDDFSIQNEKATGAYVVSPEEGLEWVPKQRWTFNVDLLSRPTPGQITFKLPAAIGANLPKTVELGERIKFDLSGDRFDFAAAAIFDMNGDLVYDSKPTKINEILDLIFEPVDELIIPKNAFPAEGLYIMGIAGLTITQDENLTDLNSALSKFFYGQMKLAPIAVGSPIAANAFLMGTAPPPPLLAPLVASAGYGAGTSMTLNVIDLTKFGDPLLEATVDLEGVQAFDREDVGVYTIDLEEGPEYQAGVEWTIHVDHPDLDQASVLRQVLPFPPDPGIDPIHTLNTEMVIDIGSDYAISVVVVLGDAGVLFTNEPGEDAILAILEEDTVASPVTIPASAFDTLGVRAIGVAGIAKADVDNFDSVLADFSTMMAGQMEFFAVEVRP